MKTIICEGLELDLVAGELESGGSKADHGEQISDADLKGKADKGIRTNLSDGDVYKVS